MYDMKTLRPTPTDLGTRREFVGVNVPISRLLERVIAERQQGRLEGMTFTDCVIVGPGVVVPDQTTILANCNLGNVKGDVRNLLLRSTGPMITGCISLVGCRFDGCLFTGVGFAGNEHYVEAMVRELSGSTGPAS